MNIGFRRWGYLVTLRVSRYGPISGVHSNLADGKHFFMADFDGPTFEAVRDACRFLQGRLKLSTVTIVQTSEGNHFHAYSMTRLSWGKLVGAWLDTPEVDQQWVKLSVMRCYGTLRYSKRDETAPRAVERIPSPYGVYKPNVSVVEITNFSTLAGRVK